MPELRRTSESHHVSAVLLKNPRLFGLKQTPQAGGQCLTQTGFAGAKDDSGPSANLLASLESIALSTRQRALIAVVVFAMVAFALYACITSGNQLALQAWTEGRDAGYLKASDPVHEIECPYNETRMSDAWHAGFREGMRVGLPKPAFSGHQ